MKRHPNMLILVAGPMGASIHHVLLRMVEFLQIDLLLGSKQKVNQASGVDLKISQSMGTH